MKARVVKITPLEKDHEFIWALVRFKDEDESPSPDCDVHIPLFKETIKDLSFEEMQSHAVTEATMFLERVLSSRSP